MTRRILSDPVSYPDTFSGECKGLCERLLEKDPEKRLGFKNDSCKVLREQPFFAEISWSRLEAGVFVLKHANIWTDSFMKEVLSFNHF